jgi:hypothetical protein
LLSKPAETPQPIPDFKAPENTLKSDENDELIILLKDYISSDPERAQNFSTFLEKKGQELTSQGLEEYFSLGIKIYNNLKWKQDWPVRIPNTLLYLD